MLKDVNDNWIEDKPMLCTMDTNYFTKWVEARPMALTDWKGVA